MTFQAENARTRSIHVLVGGLEAEPTVANTRAFFREYVARYHYKNVTEGTLRIQGHEFFWGQYLRPQGVLVRKYSATINRVEHVITCRYGIDAAATERDVNRAEQEYDEILSTLCITETATLDDPQQPDGVASLFRRVVVLLGSAALAGAAWAGWFDKTLSRGPLLTFGWAAAGDCSAPGSRSGTPGSLVHVSWWP